MGVNVNKHKIVEYSLNKFWTIYIPIVSILIGLYILYSGEEPGYSLMFLLPMLYGLMLVLSKSVYKFNKGNFGFNVLNFIMFTRYVVTPFSVVLSDYYGGIGPDPSHQALFYSFMLMFYEMIAVFITINLFGKKIYSSKVRGQKNNIKTTFINTNIVLIVFSVLSLVFLLQYPGILLPNNLLIINEEIESIVLDSQFSGMPIVVSSLFKVILFLLVIDFFKRRYDRSHNPIYPYLAVAILLLYMALMTGTARWDILIPAIVGTYILVRQYPRFRKVIITTIPSIALASILSITIYKFFAVTIQGQMDLAFYTDEILKQFQAYFSGPRNVAIGYEMQQNLGNNITVVTFINDFLGSVPGLSNLINQSDRINAHFNYYIYGEFYRTTQIIPMVSVGFSYLGFIGAPLFTSICIYLSMKMDVLAKNENRIEFTYLYAYASFWFALSMGFNTQIIFGWLIVTFLPLYLLFIVNRKVVIKK